MTIFLVQKIILQLLLRLCICGKESVLPGIFTDAACQNRQTRTSQYQKKTPIGNRIHTLLPPF